MAYFHGTNMRLSVGDTLFPGDDIGVSHYGRSKHVYATHSDFSLTEVDDALPSNIRTAEQYALYMALTWGCFAADDSDCSECAMETSHYYAPDSHIKPDCVYVYEIEPIGRMEYDDANDCGPEGCRVPEAKILRILTDRDIAEFLDWS